MSFRRLALCTIVLLPLGCGSAQPPPAEDPAAASRAELTTPAATATSAPEAQAVPAAAQPPAEAPKPAPATDPAAGGDASSVKGANVVSDRLSGGTYTQAEVKDAVLKNSALFDQCYLIGAGNSPQFVAKVTVQATVGPSGTVTVSQVKKSTANNKKVDTCVADAFKKIKFPQPRGAATSVITFPIEFNGAEEVRP